MFMFLRVCFILSRSKKIEKKLIFHICQFYPSFISAKYCCKLCDNANKSHFPNTLSIKTKYLTTCQFCNELYVGEFAFAVVVKLSLNIRVVKEKKKLGYFLFYFKISFKKKKELSEQAKIFMSEQHWT